MRTSTSCGGGSRWPRWTCAAAQTWTQLSRSCESAPPGFPRDSGSPEDGSTRTSGAAGRPPLTSTASPAEGRRSSARKTVTLVGSTRPPCAPRGSARAPQCPRAARSFATLGASRPGSFKSARTSSPIGPFRRRPRPSATRRSRAPRTRRSVAESPGWSRSSRRARMRRSAARVSAEVSRSAW